MRPSFQLAVLLSGTLLLASCSEGENLEVEIWLPKGTKGVFTIREDKKKGKEVRRTDNKAILSIPSDGKLVLKDASFLARWHSRRNFYEDGSSISSAGPGDSREGIACWELFSTENTSFYFVGTQTEVKAIAELRVKDLNRYFLSEHYKGPSAPRQE